MKWKKRKRLESVFRTKEDHASFGKLVKKTEGKGKIKNKNRTGQHLNKQTLCSHIKTRTTNQEKMGKKRKTKKKF